MQKKTCRVLSNQHMPRHEYDISIACQNCAKHSALNISPMSYFLYDF